MIYKGCVLSLEKGYAIVMTESAEYMRVAVKNGLAVGAHIVFTNEDIFRDKRAVTAKALRSAAAFAILLFAAAVQFFYSNDNVAGRNIAAVVSLDINPSIELEINTKGEVVSTISLNEDGNSIVDGELDKKPVVEVLCKLLENAEAKGYLDHNENYILISLSAINKEVELNLEDIEEKVSRFANGSSRFTNISFMFVQGSKTILEEARQNGISPGRYYLYEKLIEEQKNLTVTDAGTMELKELFYRLRHRQSNDHQIETFSGGNSVKLLTQAVYEQQQQRERVRIMEAGRVREAPRNQTGTQSRTTNRMQEEVENKDGGIDKKNEIQNENRVMNEEKSSSGEESGNGQTQAPLPQGEPQNQEQSMGIDADNDEKGKPDVETTPGNKRNEYDDKGSRGKNEDGGSNKSGKGN